LHWVVLGVCPPEGVAFLSLGQSDQRPVADLELLIKLSLWHCVGTWCPLVGGLKLLRGLLMAANVTSPFYRAGSCHQVVWLLAMPTAVSVSATETARKKSVEESRV
jgi:hypothetical protein